jgi:aspartyl-tRNA(Asn)/glutamyl-tRNA(Gln) amidotransferase subunit A
MNKQPTDIHCLSATELVSLFRRRELSPVEATRAVLERIEAFQQTINAFILVDAEPALAAATASEKRWAKDAPASSIDGVPTTVKDLLLAKGWPTRRGSKAVDPAGPWTEDAPAVARLRESGAVFLGKTTTPEFGWKGITDSPLSGITCNPWDTSRTPGGSSGGAAAAAALGMGTLHVGTDGGGSVRIPAGFTGVFGFKPSFGRVPTWPLSMVGTLSHVGPITRTVEDAAMMMSIISRPDARDWGSLPYDERDYCNGLRDGVEGLRIAFSPTLGYVDIVDPEVATRVAAAAKAFEMLGATVEEADPGFDSPNEVFLTHWCVGAAKLLANYSSEQQEVMDDGLRKLASLGAETSLFDYLDAVGARSQLGQTMREFHEDYDLLLTPTLPIPAFEAGLDTPGSGNLKWWADWTPFSYPFNLTQQPAASVPCGFTSEGLPVGLQIVGPMHGDALVLRAANAYEQAYPFQMPATPKDDAGEDCDPAQ